MYRDKIDAYFEDCEAEFVESLAKLVAIRSVVGQAEEGMPYGRGPAEALALGLEMAASAGLATRNLDNQVGIVDLNDKESNLGILCHLDVVDVGEGWNTPPFSATIENGMIYGRGVNDDKGPAVAALYAIKAVKDLGIPLKYNVRLVLGTAEETGSSDITYYLSREDPPPNVFSPDGNFPVVNTEKGSLRVTFTKSWAPSDELPRIVSVKGGQVRNVVPGKAEAVVEGLPVEEIESVCNRVGIMTGAAYSIAERDGTVEILAHGHAEHASTPEKGCNAITAMLAVLTELPLAGCEGSTMIKAVNDLFPHGDYYGSAIGIAQSDAISGPLTLSFDIYEQTLTGLKGYIDSRTPLCTTRENSFEIVKQKFDALGVKIDSRIMRPHHTPCESEFIQVLLQVYEEYTGNKGYCEAVGGGTYVHTINGGVCYGAGMPGFESNVHGANERMPIKDLITAAKIFAQVIIEICK